MRLLLTRNDRSRFFGGRSYSLNIESESSNIERRVIAHHNLWDTICVTTEDFDRHQAQAKASLQTADDLQAETFWLWRDFSEDVKVCADKWALYAKASRHAKRAEKSFYMTVRNLVDGDFFETTNLADLINVENQLQEAISNLNNLFYACLAYEGSQEILEPQQGDDKRGIDPQHWSPPLQLRKM